MGGGFEQLVFVALLILVHRGSPRPLGRKQSTLSVRSARFVNLMQINFQRCEAIRRAARHRTKRVRRLDVNQQPTPLAGRRYEQTS
ncbi:hypothetical protein D3C76_871690 [compost metagenome]|jgi:hypothetical protein